MLRYAVLFMLCVLVVPVVRAGNVHVAVASNFMHPAKEIAKAFQMESGQSVVLSFGSTGKLYTQILNGAPFVVFLAADQARPQKLSGERFTYALGKLALYPAQDQSALNRNDIQKLAIANPKTAPYGVAAMEVLEKLGLSERFGAHLVRGENIAQTYQFVSTGNAQLGFVALSQVVDKKRWIVPQTLYAPIKQDVVLLKKESKVARAFFDFLRSARAQSIIRQYGYGIE